MIIPGNNGDCLLAASGGAGNVVRTTVRGSALTQCANNGLTFGSSVANGEGPTAELTLDVADSTITGNRGNNLRIGNVTALDRLSVRVQDTDLSDARGNASIDAGQRELRGPRDDRVGHHRPRRRLAGLGGRQLPRRRHAGHRDAALRRLGGGQLVERAADHRPRGRGGGHGPGARRGAGALRVSVGRILGVLALAGAVAATPAPAAPKLGARTERPVLVRPHAAVRVTLVRQYEPLPAALGAPPSCDWVAYLRYRMRGGPQRSTKADAVFVAMPGFFGGALPFDTLARNVLHQASSHGADAEFWALERRSNCLEDRRGIRAGIRRHSYRPALDYYFNGARVGGRRFAGFRTSEETPYLSAFGLERTLRDEYAIIRRAIPRGSARGRKVFCGGHSLGGSITAAFATWDFDGDAATTRDAGYAQCAGFFALDTTVSNNLGGGAKELGTKGDAFYAAETAAITAGVVPRTPASHP